MGATKIGGAATVVGNLEAQADASIAGTASMVTATIQNAGSTIGGNRILSTADLGSGGLPGGGSISDAFSIVYTQANNAYNAANQGGGSGSYQADIYANGVLVLANATLDLLNTSTITIQTVANGNTQVSVSFSANVEVIAGPAYDQANAARTQANSAYGQANAAYAEANTANGLAQTASTTATSAYGQANAARTQANSAYTQANNAYAAANAAAANGVNTAYSYTWTASQTFESSIALYSQYAQFILRSNNTPANTGLWTWYVNPSDGTLVAQARNDNQANDNTWLAVQRNSGTSNVSKITVGNVEDSPSVTVQTNNLQLETTTPTFSYYATGASANQAYMDMYMYNGGWQMRIVDDGYNNANIAFQVTRSGYSVTGITYGNSNDYPPHAFWGALTINPPSGSWGLISNTSPNNAVGLGLATNGVARWFIAKNQNVETGANTGSDFGIYAYADNGAYIGEPIGITRSNMQITFNGECFFNNGTTWVTGSLAWQGVANGYIYGSGTVMSYSSPATFQWEVNGTQVALLDTSGLTLEGNITVGGANVPLGVVSGNTSNITVTIAANGYAVLDTKASSAGGGSNTTIISYQNTATTNQTTFVLSVNVASDVLAIVTKNGLLQQPGTHYTISNNQLTFSSNCANNDLIEARIFETNGAMQISGVGGTNQDIQYNNSGILGGSPGFTYNPMSNLVYANGQVQATSFAAEYANTGSVSGNVSLDCNSSGLLDLTLTGNVNVTLQNCAVSGHVHTVLVLVRQTTGSNGVTWTNTIRWSDGTVPVLSTGANVADMFQFTTYNNGVIWLGAQVYANLPSMNIY